MSYSRFMKFLFLSIFTIFITGCLTTGTTPQLGGGSGNTVTGAAAGSSSENKSSQLESCSEPLGTASIFEDQTRPWWNYYYRHYYRTLGSTVPVVRTMIQQSNCFVIVERGAAMRAMQRERQLMQSGELRNNSNFGKGQLAAADYTISPSVTFQQSNMGKIRGAARKFLPGSLFGAASVGAKSNEASTTLLMIDNRSGVQVASSVGSAKNFDFSVHGYSWGRGAWGSASSFTKTPEGKVILASFMDSYNHMVKAVRNYKPQKVKGGLGTGGQLKVDGAVDAKPAKKPQSKTYKKRKAKTVAVARENNVNVRGTRMGTVSVDAYDEAALNDYYRALKKAVENLSKYAAMTPQQIDALSKNNKYGIDFWSLLWAPSFAGKFETSKIELESWPLEARQKGWSILGKKIKKYNKLFYKHRKTILSTKGIRKDVKQKLKDIELVTEKSLFAG